MAYIFQKVTRKGPPTIFKYIQVNRNLLTFLFFLVVSSISWLLTALNQDYTTDILCRLEFTNLPGNKALSSEENPPVRLSVNGHGYTLLWYKLNPGNIFPFSLQMIGIQSGMQDGSYKYWLLSRQIKERLQPDFGSDITINNVSPDTLFVGLCEKTSRKILVEPRLDIRLARQYMLCGAIKCVPDSIVVSGPKTIIDTMTNIPTILYETKALRESFSTDLEIQHYRTVTLSQSFVRMTVCAEKFTESELNIPINAINLPEGIHLKTFPSEIRLTYRVGLSHFKMVQPDLFILTVDYKEAIKPDVSKLSVSLSRSPDWTEVLKFTPRTVDFILEK